MSSSSTEPTGHLDIPARPRADVSWTYPTAERTHGFLMSLAQSAASASVVVEGWAVDAAPAVVHLSRTCAYASAQLVGSQVTEAATTVDALRQTSPYLAGLPAWCALPGAGMAAVSQLLSLMGVGTGEDSTEKAHPTAADSGTMVDRQWCVCLPDDRQVAALVPADMAHEVSRLARVPHRFGEQDVLETVASIRMRLHTTARSLANWVGVADAADAQESGSQLSASAALSLMQNLRAQMSLCLGAWESSSVFADTLMELLRDRASAIDTAAAGCAEECAGQWAEAINSWSGGAQTPASLALLHQVAARSVAALAAAGASGRYGDALEGECVWVYARPSMTTHYAWAFAQDTAATSGLTMPLLRVPIAVLPVLDATVIVAVSPQIDAPTITRAWSMRTYGDLVEVDDLAAALLAAQMVDCVS